MPSLVSAPGTAATTEADTTAYLKKLASKQYSNHDRIAMPQTHRKEENGKVNGNGITSNGSSTDGSMTNGTVTRNTSVRSNSSLRNAMSINQVPSPLPTPSLEKGSSQSRYGRPDGRLAQRDDGFFAVADSADIVEGTTETKVKLREVNTEGGTEIITEQGTVVASPVSIEEVQAKTTAPPSSTASRLESAALADNTSKSTPNPHRISSPPAFQHSVLGPPQMPRLQHRHTLEVPRLSSSRRSGDEDSAIATGRNTPNSPARRRGSITLVRRATRSIHSDMHLDDVPQDEDAARWAELIKQKRASKTRRKKEDEDDDKVLMGTKVDQNHVNYVTAYNMLTGIRFTVSRTNAKLDRELTDADFASRHKFSFDVTGNELTPSAKYDFKFKDYAPWVFRRLRSMFHLDPADYLMSLTSKYILSELGSPGKSGSFFYFSRDYKYIIKTIHHAEHKFLRRILKDYYYHVEKNPNTLLSQFYGLHRVKAAWSSKKIHFVVMNNLFPPHRDIHRTFDLKGSTIGRDFKEEDLESNPRATLKDLNWLRRNLHLEFGPIKKKMFVNQMEQDVKFLQRNKIMDYSLLVGIHDLERGNKDDLRNKTLQVFQPGGEKHDEEEKTNILMRTPSKLESAKKAKELRATLRTEKPVPMEQTALKMPDEIDAEKSKNFYFYKDDGGFRATHEDNTPGEEIYYLGIIDCLTHYSLIKRLEHFIKGIAHEESQISAIPPERYGDRFVRFMTGVTKTREAAEKEARATGSIEDPRLSSSRAADNVLANVERNQTDPVMIRAEKAAERSVSRGEGEQDVPNRSLSSVRSPEGERGEPPGFTLPVVEEMAESQSVGGRSTGDGESSVGSPRRSRGEIKTQQQEGETKQGKKNEKWRLSLPSATLEPLGFGEKTEDLGMKKE